MTDITCPSPHRDALPDSRWLAVVNRDLSADGSFFYSVKTTGVYCRPSCCSRRPRRENVAFHETRDAAERAGFRPCKRCRPSGPPAHRERDEKIAQLCRMIANSEAPPSLSSLAETAGWSEHHTHRTFKSVTGMTPHEYASACRAGRLRHALHTAGSVTDAIYAAGYNSPARVYEHSRALLGMTPSDYRAGAPEIAIRFAIGECTLGTILVAGTDMGVCAILLGEDPETLVRDLERRFPRAQLTGAEAAFDRRVAQVVGLVEQPHTAAELPLDIRGSVFQQRVWKALRQIPVGSTMTYSEVAAVIGSPRAARAVAKACAANPLAVAIPCHRVVRQDGTLSGYRWGVERKRELLAREAHASD